MDIDDFIEEVQIEEGMKTVRDLALEMIELQMEMTTLEKRLEEVKALYIEKAPKEMELSGIIITLMDGRKTQTQRKDIDIEEVKQQYPNAIQYKLDAKYIPKEEHSKYFTHSIGKTFTVIKGLPKAV